LIDGALTLSEAVLHGQCDREVLISTYTCHPSMANNELSGPLVAAFLYDALSNMKSRRLTYRFVFLAETVGCIAYLARRGERLKEKLAAGYVVTCAGDPGQFTYKHSRQGDTLADRAAVYVLGRLPGNSAKFIPFAPDNGSDERQYCSPGFNLPVGSIMRTMYGCYKEYHTSMDNKDFISFQSLAETVNIYLDVCRTLEVNCRYRNLMPFGEPQLGKRGLYPTLSTGQTNEWISAISWFLNMSDGEHDLLDIARMSDGDIFLLSDIAQRCLEAGLVEIVKEN